MRIILLHLSIFGCLLWTISAQLPTCQTEDFHYEYTECDSDGWRWRVSVPTPGKCEGGNPFPPKRGKDCKFTCKAGEYLDTQGDQECHPCQPGTYSMGGGVRFDDWDTLPEGFTTKSEAFGLGSFKSSLMGSMHWSPPDNCTNISWMPRGKYIAALSGECAASLVFSANLVQPGRVLFTYQYTDEDAVFHFTVQNDQCQAVRGKDSHKWPSMTDEGQWKTINVPLKTGLNLLTWKTLGVTSEEKTQIKKPILINKIEIFGVAFTSKCTKCRPGTKSEAGTDMCKECDRDTYSKKGSSSCLPCDKSIQYSEQGSGECKDKKPCTVNDYFEYNSACSNGQTQKMYKWVQPKICREDLPGAVQQPASGEKEPCPPCNPGMEINGGFCQFCPHNKYSDGNSECQECAVSTAPETGILYKWWNNLPAENNISSSCLSMNDRGCSTKEGWVLSTDNMHSGKGHADDAYLVMSLKVGGFRGMEQVLNGKSVAVGSISFVFELDCTQECTLFFMQSRRHRQSPSSGTSVIETWTGTQSKQSYTYKVTKAEEVVFSWAFQKTSGEDDSVDYSNRYDLAADTAKIYSVNVTNTLDGGATQCKSCPRGANLNGCVPCPPGNYIDVNTTQCMKCPANTIVHSGNAWGAESCILCGEGLHTTDNVHCVTDCKYRSPDGKSYDFNTLSKLMAVDGSRLFTASGTHYYHHFNISLCGTGKNFPLVECHDNISYGLDQIRNETETGEMTEQVKGIICRTTLIPPHEGEDGGIMSAQPVSLGDILVNVTSNGTWQKMDERFKVAGFDPDDSGLDVHFNYYSEMPTSACRKGRRTTITMRCDTSQKNTGAIQLPPNCPDGTCDGCYFHLLWRTEKACPVCKHEDYTVVKGECKQGKQEIHYFPPKHCMILSGNKALTKTQACAILPFWLQIAIGCIALFGILLVILLFYCWKKNRKLEYKYMKLVADANTKEGELPAAESCGLDEEDEDEQFDSVKFNEGKGRKFFSRLKKMGGKRDDMFEAINMSEKTPLS